MIAQHEARLRAIARGKIIIGYRASGNEIRPSIPCARSHLKQYIGTIRQGTTAALVGALISGQQTAIWQKTQSISVAKSPCDQLKLAAIEIAAHHGRSTWHSAWHALS